MLFLIIDGVSTMDIYHIMFIVLFVIYTLFPSVVNKFTIVLLIYCDFFVLSKYVYTLITKNDTPPDWAVLTGIGATYDPDKKDTYFRYLPRFDQWTMVVLSLILYRRQLALETNNEKKFKMYRTHAENTIKRRVSWLYRIYVVLDIIYNHIIVFAAFTIFFMILIIMQGTCINFISQVLVLILLYIYYSKGIKPLLKVWHILMFY